MKRKEWTILDDLKDDDREVCGSVLAVVGPQKLLEDMEDPLKECYEKLHLFYIPDDYGEFPDTLGYTSKNWKTLEQDMEDPNLFPFMQKALDAVLDFNNKRQDTLDRLGYRDVESFLHAPKFGGKIWAAAGFVRAYSPDYLKKAQTFVPGNITLQ